MRVALLILLALSSARAEVSTSAAFDAGLAAYQAEQWDLAIEQWQSVIATGKSSGSLEYNLGNAYFRKEDFPRAIVHYERALRLMPDDKDVEHNLLLANRGIVDQITPLPQLGVIRFAGKLRDQVSPEALMRIAVLLNLLLVVSILLQRYGAGVLRRWSARLSLAFGLLLVISTAWYFWRNSAFNEKYGIVMTERADVNSGPTAEATQLFSLHEGTKVKLGEALSDWVAVELSDGRKGWLQRGLVEEI
ncbi:MAG: tetratricopeptide repeat protein [Calditrichaeota bacterium]|nr:tetratricopeptide repeat protein [Calditrichota bacterium]MCB9391159.1 tetratricopeptide repeat protein [Calditrichota bacterium]